MGQFEEAKARILDGIFVCKKCKKKVRAGPLRVIKGMVRCRNPACKSSKLRPMKKK